MSWQQIEPDLAIQKERQLQEIFDNWPDRAWTVAGAPRWLASASNPLVGRTFRPTLGPDLKPDVIFQTETLDRVVELKLAGKGEPLALAQVLYYVHMLKADPSARRGYAREAIPISGVMVTQHNFWLRAALAELFNERTPSVQLIEYDTFTHAAQQIVWFGDPFAPWKATTDVPFELIERFGTEFWYYVETEETWICMPTRCEQRQPLFLERHVVASRLKPNNGLVAWEGSYTDSRCKYEVLLDDHRR